VQQADLLSLPHLQPKEHAFELIPMPNEAGKPVIHPNIPFSAP
jgi:hypothetical protein